MGKRRAGDRRPNRQRAAEPVAPGLEVGGPGRLAAQARQAQAARDRGSAAAPPRRTLLPEAAGAPCAARGRSSLHGRLSPAQHDLAALAAPVPDRARRRAGDREQDGAGGRGLRHRDPPALPRAGLAGGRRQHLQPRAPAQRPGGGRPELIVDLHAHYPMHLVPPDDGTLIDLLSTARGRRRLRDRVRARLIGLASRFGNYRSFESGPRVTMPQLRDGHVGVALSVVYSFFDEVDLDVPYGAPPAAGYLPRLMRQLDTVEADIAERHADEAAVVHDRSALDRELGNGRVALVHCVEGGFHLGATPEEVDRAVTRLAERGVAYIVLPHLMWRGVATNSPALPFLPDWLYRVLFHQPRLGLSELGTAAVRAMVREGILIDLSHMSTRTLEDTFALLDELDPDRRVPLIASHSAFRFGRQEYGIDEETVRLLAGRDGVVGLIFAQHQLNDGVRRRPTKSFEESFEVICRHLDRIAEITGSHRHAAIGSDFDGFIKPTMGGLESMSDMARLERALRDRHGAEDAERICSDNALRVLRAGWGAR
ncbi:MAG: hypothetical protein GEU88_15020 [Solirubrobacterales bacterium]|nr:hypothetical protein [Solirubrobacterales bacterium]